LPETAEIPQAEGVARRIPRNKWRAQQTAAAVC
jgi:hypothetical protein